MSHYMLPPFERGMQVSAESAKLDKVNILLDGWHYEGAYADVAGCVVALSNGLDIPMASNRDNIFNAPNISTQSPHIKFRKRTGAVGNGNNAYGFPIFGGIVNFNCSDLGSIHPELDDNSNDFRPSRYRIKAHLVLNPTRMFVYQDVSGVLRIRNEVGLEYPPINLFTRRCAVRTSEEYCLDGNNNVILTPRIHVMSEYPHWNVYRDNYFRGVDDYINSRLVSAMALNSPTGVSQLSRRPRYSLYKVETYWEFYCENPLRIVDQLATNIRSLGSVVRVGSYPINNGQEGLSGNSNSYRVTIARGVELCIYSKTLKRIRIEVRHTMAERVRDLNFPSSDYSKNSIEDILALIDQVTEDATTLANQALERLLPCIPNPDPPASPYELMQEIMKAVEDEFKQSGHTTAIREQVTQNQRNLLELLINRNGCYTQTRDPMAAFTARLKRRGVLERTAYRTYRLSPRFQRARQILASRVTGVDQDEPD